MEILQERGYFRQGVVFEKIVLVLPFQIRSIIVLIGGLRFMFSKYGNEVAWFILLYTLVFVPCLNFYKFFFCFFLRREFLIPKVTISSS